MRAHLDGQELDVDTGVGWSLVSGTGAHTRVLTMPTPEANALLAQATPLGSTLTLDASDDGYGKQVVSMLTILGTAPTNLRGLSAISLADHRWIWGRKHAKHSFNVRRRTGTIRRLKGGDLVPLAAQAQVPDVAYAPWSLNLSTGQPWTATEVLTDLLDQLGDYGIVYELRNLDSVNTVDVEDLEVDDSLSSSIARALGYFGNRVGIYVDWDGKVIVYDRLDGGEEAALDTDTRPPMILTGLPAKQDRSKERPTSVRVLFDTLVELRADFTETEAASNPDEDDRSHARLENVSHSPSDLDFAGGDFYRGQLLRISVLLTAYAKASNGTKPYPGLPDMSRALLRLRWLDGAMNNGWMDPADPTHIWLRRWLQLRGDYRTRLRFTKFWRDRIRGYFPVQLAVQDPEDGSQSAAAAVYADYATQELARYWNSVKRSANTSQHVGVRNIPGNPAGLFRLVGTKIGALTQSSAVVAIEDQDLGVIRIQFREEVQEGLEKVFPSAVENPYTNDTSLKNAPILSSDCNLTKDHQVSVVLAVQPAVPNNAKQLYAVEIDDPTATGQGPVIEVRVYPTVLAARFGWPNVAGGDGGTVVAGAAGGAINEASAWRSFDDGAQAVEQGYGPPLNLDQLRALARAQADAVYAFYADHVEGGLTTVLSANEQLRGTLNSVSCEIAGSGPTGGALLVLDSAPEPPRIDAVALLPRAVRRVILRQVDLRQ